MILIFTLCVSGNAAQRSTSNTAERELRPKVDTMKENANEMAPRVAQDGDKTKSKGSYDDLSVPWYSQEMAEYEAQRRLTAYYLGHIWDYFVGKFGKTATSDAQHEDKAKQESSWYDDLWVPCLPTKAADTRFIAYFAGRIWDYFEGKFRKTATSDAQDEDKAMPKGPSYDDLVVYCLPKEVAEYEMRRRLIAYIVGGIWDYFEGMFRKTRTSDGQDEEKAKRKRLSYTDLWVPSCSEEDVEFAADMRVVAYLAGSIWDYFEGKFRKTATEDARNAAGSQTRPTSADDAHSETTRKRPTVKPITPLDDDRVVRPVQDVARNENIRSIAKMLSETVQ